MSLKIRIAPSNNKMGQIPSVSLPPVGSCNPNAVCMKDGCYALKACYNRWKNCKHAWDNNLALYHTSSVDYFRQISEWLDGYVKRCKKKGVQPYFRWHVGGDFPDQTYLNWVYAVALVHPGIKFMAFTKRYDFIYHKPMPPNLCIRFSTWPKMPFPKHLENEPLSITDDGTEWRFSYLNPKPCKGACDQCYMCWHQSISAVVGQKH